MRAVRSPVLVQEGLRTLLAPMVANALPRLRTLRLNDNPHLTDAGVEALAAALRPPCAHCGASFGIDCDARTSACAACGRTPEAGWLRDEPFFDLHELELVGCGVGDAGVTALAVALTRGTRAFSLCFLALGADRVGDEGASALAAALEAGAMRRAIERRLGCLWAFGSFSATCGTGFVALTSACDRLGMRLELDHRIPWGA